jgi:hypothetical protein
MRLLETKMKRGPLSINAIFGQKIVENRSNALILIGFYPILTDVTLSGFYLID